MEFLVSFLVAFLVLGLTYAIASEGLWGASLMFFDVLFGGLIAFNFYEPLAKLLADNVSFISHLADLICLLARCSLPTFALRRSARPLGPAMVRFPAPVYHAGRWAFAFGCAAITLAICLLGFETAPVHKKIFGVMDYKTLVP